LNNNGAVNYGGAVYNNGGTMTVTNTTFANNAAAYGLGGAIDNAGTLTVSGSTFTGGDAFEGGAIDNKSGSLTVTNSTFANNTAIHGGAIFNNAAASITGSTINNNNGFQGGGLANDLAGTMTLVNSTVANNYAGQNGGGINQVGNLTSINNTIAYNIVAPGGAGGGVDASSGTAAFYNTIIAQNSAGAGANATPSDLAGKVSSASAFNLIGTGSGGLVNGSNGNLVGVASPLLGTLANNGGPTKTIALLAGSPAIGAGSSSIAGVTVPTVDQRGIARPSNAVDIGAYQTVPSGNISSGSKIAQTSSSATISFAVPTVGASAVKPAFSTTKIVGSKKAVPNGGSATKFHKPRKLAKVKHHASVSIKHHSIGVRKK
jgi:hypothetical protein